MFMNQIPYEYSIGGVFFPPLLVFISLGIIFAMLTAKLLNYFRLSQHISHPPLALLSLVVIYTVLFESFFL